jgi:hypothetical protein
VKSVQAAGSDESELDQNLKVQPNVFFFGKEVRKVQKGAPANAKPAPNECYRNINCICNLFFGGQQLKIAFSFVYDERHLSCPPFDGSGKWNEISHRSVKGICRIFKVLRGAVFLSSPSDLPRATVCSVESRSVSNGD